MLRLTVLAFVIVAFFAGMGASNTLLYVKFEKCDLEVLEIKETEAAEYYSQGKISIRHFYAYYSMRHSICMRR